MKRKAVGKHKPQPSIHDITQGLAKRGWIFEDDEDVTSPKPTNEEPVDLLQPVCSHSQMLRRMVSRRALQNMDHAALMEKDTIFCFTSSYYGTSIPPTVQQTPLKDHDPVDSSLADRLPQSTVLHCKKNIL